MTEKVKAAWLANLAKANAVDPKIRLRNTPARERARRQNLEKAWARQRDPNSLPGGHFRHGLYSKDLRRSAPLAGEHPEEYGRLRERLWQLFPPAITLTSATDYGQRTTDKGQETTP